MTTALYDVPGPRTRQRHRLYGLGGTVVILALIAWIIYLLFATGQFVSTKWTPFTYTGIQDLLLRGLGNTLKAFGLAAVLSLALGAVLATGQALRAPDRPLGVHPAGGVLPGDARAGHDLLHLCGPEGGAAARAGRRADPLQRLGARRGLPYRRSLRRPRPAGGRLRTGPAQDPGHDACPGAAGGPGDAPGDHQPAGGRPEGHLTRLPHHL